MLALSACGPPPVAAPDVTPRAGPCLIMLEITGMT